MFHFEIWRYPQKDFRFELSEGGYRPVDAANKAKR
jgi:hypothetical protein